MEREVKTTQRLVRDLEFKVTGTGTAARKTEEALGKVLDQVKPLNDQFYEMEPALENMEILIDNAANAVLSMVDGPDAGGDPLRPLCRVGRPLAAPPGIYLIKR